jgi:hypothetical protein
MTHEEKTALKLAAFQAYWGAGKDPIRNPSEAFYVAKGIEAMAAVAFAAINQMELDHDDAISDVSRDSYDDGYVDGLER